MDIIETFDDNERIDALSAMQKEGVEKMKTSLLSCVNNPDTVVPSIKQITLLRIYHQLAQIIKYTEMMDKLEAKLYQTLDSRLDNITLDPETDATNIAFLLHVQERLQQSMVISNKLLQPYLEMDGLDISALMPVSTTDGVSSANVIDIQSRDKIRTTAQSVLAVISEQSAEVK